VGFPALEVDEPLPEQDAARISAAAAAPAASLNVVGAIFTFF
jgi:hypothetical protein